MGYCDLPNSLIKTRGRQLKESIDVNSKIPITRKLEYREYVDNLTNRELRIKPLIINNEVECRNCKKILAYLDKVSDYIVYDNKFCRYCGQRLDMSEVLERKRNGTN